jgi:hypothetical protein
MNSRNTWRLIHGGRPAWFAALIAANACSWCVLLWLVTAQKGFLDMPTDQRRAQGRQGCVAPRSG